MVIASINQKETNARNDSLLRSQLATKRLHRTKAALTVLQGDTRRAATHIAYLCFDTLGRVARDRVHRLFALEISECLFDKEHQPVNSEANRRENPRTETRLEFDSISENRKKGIRSELRRG